MSAKKSKPGPKAERLKIDLPPEEAMRRLLAAKRMKAEKAKKCGGKKP